MVDPSELLRVLHENDVQYILVGGLAAVARGAPVNTFDVDIVHSRDPANVDRLLRVLDSIGAIFRVQPDRKLKPTRSHLEGTGHLNLLTESGPLDVLCTIGNNFGYADLVSRSTEMDLGEGLHIRVLDLETQIAIKEQLGTAKDLAVLPILRQTLAESKKL